VVALVHGQSIRESIDQVLGSYLHLVIAQGLLLFLLLLPYVAFLQLSDALGPGKLKQLFFTVRSRRENS